MQIAIRSKLIEAAAYDAEKRTLRIYLTNGTRREFANVPEHVRDGLISAQSAGHYYFHNIRKQFPHTD